MVNNKTNPTITTLTKTKIRISKNSAKVRLANRQITHKLKPIENALKKRLLLFYNQNIKGNYTPIEILRQRYNVQINNLIRKTIYDSYFAGSDRVVSQLHKDYSYMNVQVRDFDNINEIVEEQSNQFWTTAGRHKWREYEFQKPELALEASLIGYSAWVTYHSFNKAVVSKSQDLAALNPKNKIAAIDDEIGTEIGIPESRVVFTTAGDAKVDPVFCAPLDGQEFDINDPDLDDATPPLHLHCRCRLVPI
jgi:hypothetical protein